MASKTQITRKGAELLATSSTASGQNWWIGWYALAYVPQEIKDEEGERLTSGSTKLTTKGDIIYNIFQGDNNGEGQVSVNENSQFGIVNYDSNVKKHYRYVMDSTGRNNLVTWMSGDGGLLRGAYVYRGANMVLNDNGEESEVTASEIPLPAPLFYAGEDVAANGFTVKGMNEFLSGGLNDYYPTHTAKVDDVVTEVPSISTDFRNYESYKSGVAVGENLSEDYSENLPLKRGEYDMDSDGWVRSDMTYTQNEDYTMKQEFNAYCTEYWKALSISNFNKYCAPVNSAGLAYNEDAGCRNMAKVTKYFPIYSYDVISTKETESNEYVTGIKLGIKLNITSNKMGDENYFDAQCEQNSDGTGVAYVNQSFKDIKDGSGNQIFSSQSISFKFNRIGIYAVPMRQYGCTGDNKTVAQYQIDTEKEPVLFAICDWDSAQVLSDNGEGLSTFESDIAIDLSMAVDDSGIIRDSAIYYNLYEDTAIDWYKNQLLANASMSEAIIDMQMQLGNIQQHMDADESKCCNAEGDNNEYALKNHTHPYMKNLVDAQDYNLNSVRNIKALEEGANTPAIYNLYTTNIPRYNCPVSNTIKYHEHYGFMRGLNITGNSALKEFSTVTIEDAVHDVELTHALYKNGNDWLDWGEEDTAFISQYTVQVGAYLIGRYPYYLCKTFDDMIHSSSNTYWSESTFTYKDRKVENTTSTDKTTDGTTVTVETEDYTTVADGQTVTTKTTTVAADGTTSVVSETTTDTTKKPPNNNDVKISTTTVKNYVGSTIEKVTETWYHLPSSMMLNKATAVAIDAGGWKVPTKAQWTEIIKELNARKLYMNSIIYGVGYLEGTTPKLDTTREGETQNESYYAIYDSDTEVVRYSLSTGLWEIISNRVMCGTVERTVAYMNALVIFESGNSVDTASFKYNMTYPDAYALMSGSFATQGDGLFVAARNSGMSNGAADSAILSSVNSYILWGASKTSILSASNIKVKYGATNIIVGAGNNNNIESIEKLVLFGSHNTVYSSSLVSGTLLINGDFNDYHSNSYNKTGIINGNRNSFYYTAVLDGSIVSGTDNSVYNIAEIKASIVCGKHNAIHNSTTISSSLILSDGGTLHDTCHIMSSIIALNNSNCYYSIASDSCIMTLYNSDLHSLSSTKVFDNSIIALKNSTINSINSDDIGITTNLMIANNLDIHSTTDMPPKYSSLLGNTFTIYNGGRVEYSSIRGSSFSIYNSCKMFYSSIHGTNVNIYPSGGIGALDLANVHIYGTADVCSYIGYTYTVGNTTLAGLQNLIILYGLDGTQDGSNSYIATYMSSFNDFIKNTHKKYPMIYSEGGIGLFGRRIALRTGEGGSAAPHVGDVLTVESVDGDVAIVAWRASGASAVRNIIANFTTGGDVTSTVNSFSTLSIATINTVYAKDIYTIYGTTGNNPYRLITTSDTLQSSGYIQVLKGSATSAKCIYRLYMKASSTAIYQPSPASGAYAKGGVISSKMDENDPTTLLPFLIAPFTTGSDNGDVAMYVGNCQYSFSGSNYSYGLNTSTSRLNLVLSSDSKTVTGTTTEPGVTGITGTVKTSGDATYPYVFELEFMLNTTSYGYSLWSQHRICDSKTEIEVVYND